MHFFAPTFILQFSTMFKLTVTPMETTVQPFPSKETQTENELLRKFEITCEVKQWFKKLTK